MKIRALGKADVRRILVTVSFVVAYVISSLTLSMAVVAARSENNRSDVTMQRDIYAPCPSALGTTPRPPNPKLGKAPTHSGEVDLPYPFEAGSIRVRIACGQDINALLARHGLRLNGRVAHWSPPPFDVYDRRAGLDRSFRIAVPPGTEKLWVKRLSLHTDQFDWVLMTWRPPVHVAFAPNDPYYTSNLQKNMTAVNMASAWDRTLSWDAIQISIIDSGLRGSHEDFQPASSKQKTGYDYIQQLEIAPGTGVDSGCAAGHGSNVASIAAGSTHNSLGVAGAGFNSSIRPIRTINSGCGWQPGVTRDWPVRWGRYQGTLITNMSYAFNLSDPDEEAVMQETWNAGVTLVAAAGNGGSNLDVAPVYPCAYAYVICVGAAYANQVMCDSNYGPNVVDFAAPAEGSYGAGSGADDTYILGGCKTSYAAPLVSGVAALLRSIGKTPTDQYGALAFTARPNTWTIYGFIDAGAALWR